MTSGRNSTQLQLNTNWKEPNYLSRPAPRVGLGTQCSPQAHWSYALCKKRVLPRSGIRKDIEALSEPSGVGKNGSSNRRKHNVRHFRKCWAGRVEHITVLSNWNPVQSLTAQYPSTGLLRKNTPWVPTVFVRKTKNLSDSSIVRSVYNFREPKTAAEACEFD